MAIPSDEWRLLVFAAIGFMLSMFVLANEPEGGEAALWYIYLILFWVGTAIWAHGNQGISKKWPEHIMIGALLGGGFIALHSWQPAIFRLGFPNAVENVRFLIVGIIAPIGEELAFRQGIFLNLLRNKGRYSFVQSTIICTIIFTSFHYFAYGIGTATAAFIGAATFSTIACWLAERTKGVVAPTIAHMAVNLSLLLLPVVIIGVK